MSIRALAGPAALALVLAACGGNPPSAEMTDPIAIVEAATTQAANAQSVHVDLSADGTVTLDVTGTGAAAPIQLTGTTASLDLDLADAAARATFAIPGVLGLRGELIAVDEAAYIKTSLTGALYQKTTLDSADIPTTGASPDPSAVAQLVAGVREALDQPGVDPVKGTDVACGTVTCYTVSMQLTPEELEALDTGGEMPVPSGLPIPIPEVGDQTIEITLRVAKDTSRLAGMTLAASGATTGQITAELTFSKWDEELTITAPPPDQVQGG